MESQGLFWVMGKDARKALMFGIVFVIFRRERVKWETIKKFSREQSVDIETDPRYHFSVNLVLLLSLVKDCSFFIKGPKARKMK